MNDYKATFEARGHDYNEAGRLCPGAREAERSALLNRAKLQPGLSILDLPAGGGYVADGVRERLGTSDGVVCVEPSPRFGESLRQHYQARHEPIDETGLPSASFDRILSLAGLHHLPERTDVYREWARLLKPGGQIVVADVAAGSGAAAFLNEFVDQFTPGGHCGYFIAEQEFTAGLEAQGLRVLEDQLLDVPWRFPDRRTLGEFCWKLFSCRDASPERVADGLAEFVGIHQEADNEMLLHWQLRYAVAIDQPQH